MLGIASRSAENPQVARLPQLERAVMGTNPFLSEARVRSVHGRRFACEKEFSKVLTLAEDERARLQEQGRGGQRWAAFIL